MVYDKIDQHNTLYDSYNGEIVSTFIGSLKIENPNNNYNISNEIKFDSTNESDKFLMYRQFVAWNTEVCSIAPLTEYSNNDAYRELPRLNNSYDKTKSDKHLHIDLRRGHNYICELEKINRNDSNLTLTVTLKQAEKKN